MRKYIAKMMLLGLLLALSVTACKKDALEVDRDKNYLQVNAPKTTDPLISNSVSLTLKPGGKAAILPGGDIMWTASYTIRGKKLKVKVPDLDTEFNFVIISETELHGENGEVLKLQE